MSPFLLFPNASAVAALLGGSEMSSTRIPPLIAAVLLCQFRAVVWREQRGVACRPAHPGAPSSRTSQYDATSSAAPLAIDCCYAVLA